MIFPASMITVFSPTIMAPRKAKKGKKKPAKRKKKVQKRKVKKVVRKKAKKVAKKKPASKLNPQNLKVLGEASLDDKIEVYQKKGGDSIDAFLSSLSKEHRESLWQRFKYARQENPDLAKKYEACATGAKSSGTKKTLLNSFLKLGHSCKGTPYVEALTQISVSRTSSTSSEWVPLNTIMKKYGMGELMRRVNRGSVQVRADPSDPEEYEFMDTRKVELDSTTELHTANVQRKDKVSIEDYIKVKSAASIGADILGGSAAVGFLTQVKGGKTALPLKDGAPSDEGDGDDEGDETKKLESQADMLTQFKHMGAKGKTASVRVDEMLEIFKKLIKDHPKDKDKDVHAMLMKRVLCLQNLKKNKNLDLDTCKTVLMDAAQVVKKVNKLS